MEFDIVQGDIASQSADALVNAAGTSLRMGSGVAGALSRGAGPQLNEEAMAKGPIDLGEVAVTDAYDLEAEYVIHAAAMPHDGDGKATAASIRSATKKSFERADALECASLVIPALGCGVAGFDFEEGVDLIVQEIEAYESTTLEDVRLIAYSDEEFETIERVAQAYRHYRGSS
ncbi:macro domain-containing protein [Natrialbaceae archaeon A-CW3]